MNFFPFREEGIKLLEKYFLKQESFLPLGNNNQLSKYPFETLGSLIAISTFISQDYSNASKIFKVLLKKIYAPLFDFTENNRSNIIILYHIL